MKMHGVEVPPKLFQPIKEAVEVPPKLTQPIKEGMEVRLKLPQMKIRGMDVAPQVRQTKNGWLIIITLLVNGKRTIVKSGL